MRIGIIAPEFPPDIGGMEIYAYELSQQLASKGHDVIVFTRPHLGGEISNSNLTILPILTGKLRSDRQIIKKNPMDLWHCMNAGYSWASLYAKPVIVSIHGADFLSAWIRPLKLDFWLKINLLLGSRLTSQVEKWLSKKMMARTLPQCRWIISNSAYTERVFLEKYPSCKGMTSVGGVGLAQSFLDYNVKSRTERHRETRFITVSRLSETYKNIDSVIMALGILHKEGYAFRYTIIGQGQNRSSLEQLAYRLGISERINFVGFAHASLLKELLAESDLFILTSVEDKNGYEGFGIVYLEANACGIPVLASKIAGPAEVVKEGINGFFVEDPKPEVIALALKRFLRKEIYFNSEACQAYARQFTWEKVAEHVLSVYKRFSVS